MKIDEKIEKYLVNEKSSNDKEVLEKQKAYYNALKYFSKNIDSPKAKEMVRKALDDYLEVGGAEYELSHK